MRSAKAITIIVTFLIITFSLGSFADEGMWVPNTIKILPFDSLRNRGLQLGPEQIYSPTGGALCDAVVIIDGGSGSFISPEGLVITNHHVGFTAIQRQSTPEHNYLEKGFYARTRAEELPAIGYDVFITRSYQDVTKRVLAALNDKMTGLERTKAIEKISKKIIAEAEKNPDIECKVASYYSGQQYILITYFKIRDVRLVFAPPRSIGDYGGETDNWMWPRHAGDFAIFRAYVTPDGHASDYDPQNVPYQSKKFLPISLAGVEENDLLMVIGFPGNTNRYEPAANIEEMITFDYPLDIKSRLEIIAHLEEAAAANPVDAIKLSSPIKGLYNYLKKNRGMLEGFERGQLLQKKQATEKGLTEFIASTPELQKKYGHVLPGIDSLFEAHKSWRDKAFVMDQLVWRCDFADFAAIIYKWAVEKEKKDMDREPGYQDRDTLDTQEYLFNAQTNLVPSADKEVFIHVAEMALNLPEGQKIAAIEKIIAGHADNPVRAIREFADNLYAGTQLGDSTKRVEMFHMSRARLERLNDPFISFAMILESEREDLRTRNKAFSGVRHRLEPMLIAAYAEWKNGRMYPDANGTMRINFGTVKGYAPRDAVTYHYMTTLNGIVEKDTGEEPFDAPTELVSAYAVRDFGPYVDNALGDIPVDYLSDNDITNGNSGSPVMNGKGELVGLAFDGNYESMTSDYQFEPDITRTITVDIRYALYLMDKVYHADELLKEMTIVR